MRPRHACTWARSASSGCAPIAACAPRQRHGVAAVARASRGGGRRRAIPHLMIRRLAARLARMDADRNRAGARPRRREPRSSGRSAAPRRRPRWHREHLLGAPVARHRPRCGAARIARIVDGMTRTASWRVTSRARRTASSSGNPAQDAVVARITADFPGAAREAAARADRILAAQYDLLGYRGLRFHQPAVLTHLTHLTYQPHLAQSTGISIRCTAGARRWSSGPTSRTSIRQCGDHKIVWELNRHQHWLALGRAFWLTGDRQVSRALRRGARAAGSIAIRR